ncbi:NAD(+) synthase [Bariatricus massiliensis]|uniref:Glutamine-dependent NAD(+) synthetase n=1 Tax=Bariatricus massiliensis TaxID=1745713 RepID=A0ABS8DLR6_9FIRM|nr:NAD(+) synthase [Bariatricus massiliensis]MCB7303183.1 NAD(+) synthase [Bariatricus massiliensis]MCB7376634.1 NAD(+) synthase [Bariatricus massiliensis]MCB7389292.1 NAD(+) synthase [Bariatricus massiliensis]MCB7413428.1 NAD(+) synthase [Bariatricus massiliensis]MCQ5252057.1 NAD(+) synthase [Bariatricus massiliensis]
MKQGFVKVAAATPDIRVADVWHNCEEIRKLLSEAEKEGAKVIVFPELCLTGYTCQDLFTQDILLKEARRALERIAQQTKNSGSLVFVGMPLAVDGELYNVAAALNDGRILGFTTKTFLTNYGEFYEMRQFRQGPEKARVISYEGQEIWFGPQLLYQAEEMNELIVSAEICEDVWSPVPPSIQAAREGAVILVNCSASDETVGKDSYRQELIKGQSARLMAGYVYANAGDGESTTDLVFGGHNIIAENGTILKEARRFTNEMIISEIDISRMLGERRKNTTFQTAKERNLPRISFTVNLEETRLTRRFGANPFVPQNMEERAKRCEEILMIQAMGLKKRLLHTNSKTAVVGISGGLDSTLALLVTAKAFDMAGKKRKDIIAVTMPCFGTTDRTYHNACLMSEKLGATLREVPIADAVRTHFRDIGHDEDVHDVTYENAQARERTQVLMDIANQEMGMVIGTGDMSELALGWATYNGDHMSMYGVNASVPKTLVIHLVKYYADTCEDAELRAVLLDVLDTPVSPELLPPKDGEIAQKTEDLVGPYELHDFYLYYVLRFGFEPGKIYRLAKIAFEEQYDDETILKWLRTFYRRFFTQQFKRSCLPDGPKIGTVALSPRGDWRMPSDACAAVWMKDLENLTFNKTGGYSL